MRRVRVENISKGTVLAEQAGLAQSFLTRLRGLLGRRSLDEGQGLVIQPTDMIHTFFMAFAIDVAFVDRQDRVLKTVAGMKPWRASPLVRRSHRVVELPVGVLAHTRTEAGDQLRIGDAVNSA